MVGKKFGKKVQELIQKGKVGAFTELENGIEIAGEHLEVGEYDLGYRTAAGVEAEASNTAVVLLDTEITPELEIEGISREIIRGIQELRKTLGFKISDHIAVQWNSENEKVIAACEQFGEKMSKEVLAHSFNINKNSNITGESLLVDEMEITLVLAKI